MAKNLSVSELDFDTIKSNLKEFFKSQDEFNSYDFDGAALNILMDILAYNTHYNSIYQNLTVNEAFLDSASKRISVVSRAKDLGYIPRSARTARAVITLTINEPQVTSTSIVLPRGSAFTSVVDGITYTFYTREDITTTKDSNGDFVFTDISIYEGIPLTNSYTYTDGINIIIPNRNCDLESLVVSVQEFASASIFEIYNKAESMINITATDPVYFVREIDNNLYEIEFGNDRIGKKLSPGNVVTLNYFVTNSGAPNGAKTFHYTGNVGLGTPSIVTVAFATGGDDPEDIESIRFNAPKYYAAQNRAVIPEDYASIILKNYPNVESINIWGGEDNTPPVYGKVFISIKPEDANILPQAYKDFIIQDILKSKNVLTIKPEIVDPNVIYLEVNSTVYYNTKLTARSPEDIKTLVQEVILAYNEENLNKFDGVFRYSRFTNAIDTAEDSILNNITNLKLHRVIEPSYGLAAKYDINIGNPIYSVGTGNVISTGFYLVGNPNIHYLEDGPDGSIVLYYREASGNKIIVNSTFGTINYALGIITIDSLTINSLADSDFRLTIIPASNDVVSVRNNIVLIDDELVTINIISDKVAGGDSAGGASYVFTPSKN